MASAPAAEIPTYESRLDLEKEWALDEGFRHFQGTSEVHNTLRRICQRLKELEIPYAVVDGMALFEYGLRRFTEDVDLLVTSTDLARIHQALSGLGFIEPFEKSKHLTDVANGVKIEFLISGGFPGDGKEKPVSFPDPRDVTDSNAAVRYIQLPKLIELKLASGMTGAGRLKDLADVQELIKARSLCQEFGTVLHPYVQSKYTELWDSVHGAEESD